MNAEVGSTCMRDTTEKTRNRNGAPLKNLNAAKTLMYAHDIEERVDGRSLLAEGFAAHRGRLLALFNVASLDDLDGLEREAVRRLIKRRIVRELAWGRLQAAFEQARLTTTEQEQTAAVALYDAEVQRFDAAVRGEETTETRLDSLLQRHRKPVNRERCLTCGGMSTDYTCSGCGKHVLHCSCEPPQSSYEPPQGAAGRASESGTTQEPSLELAKPISERGEEIPASQEAQPMPEQTELEQ